ncbi:MAG: DUF21 domain-containing protein [Candidatus Omnitrophica bacterium]|nr:DUF21 domain-containing protein [Candidatus Omnitrophota bacterium]
MVYNIVILLLLFFLSAFFSGSETSLFSLSKISIRRLKVDKARNSGTVESLLSKPTDLLITILIGNMFANVFASSIAASLSIKIWGEKGVGISIAVMTVIVVIFCEIMPKIIAIKNARRFSLITAPAIALFSRLVLPLRYCLRGLAEGVLSFLVKTKKTESHITKDELESAIKVGYSREGILDKEEAEMMEDVIQLSDKRVKDVMVKEDDIISFSINMPIGRMCAAIKEAELSRIPVYETDKSNILGVLYAKDLLRKIVERREDEDDIKGLLREPFYVTRGLRLNVLLRDFISRKIHMALVREEGGQIKGIVTMEDLLEEIIGDIRDKESLLQRLIRK